MRPSTLLLRRALPLAVTIWLAVVPAACLPQPAARPSTAPAPSPTAAAPRLATVGQVAPDFALPTLGGQTARLSDYRGQVVLVNLWATWCPPCRMEVPELVSAYNRYKGRGFTILAINQGEGRGEVQAFAGEHGMSFPVLLDLERAILSAYRTRGIPTSFLVDRQGVLRQVVVGALDEEQLSRLVEPLLGN